MNKIDTVIFDLDSTLVTIEGLDWLAQKKGVSPRSTQITKLSMEGKVDFKTTLIEKMNLISPSYDDIVAMGDAYCTNIVEGAQKMVTRFLEAGIDVWIITGNFNPAVEMLSKKLGIKNVVCNKINFDSDGKYVGFDLDNPLTVNGGKAEVIKSMPNYKNRKIAFVGDGATDLETKSVVEIFIGFGGVNQRETVRQNADIYINEKSLFPLAQIIG